MMIKNPVRLALLLLGTICTLIGLAEVSRLMVLHCLSTGWSFKFCLELLVYVTGVIWVFHQFLEGVRDHV